MAKFKFTLNIGQGQAREEKIEIDDSELDGLSSIEREQKIFDKWLEWRNQYVDGGWEEITDGTD